MPTIKFSFVPERQLGKEVDETYRVSIYKHAHLYFPSCAVQVYDLSGKYIKLFADIEKRAIGWQVIEGKTDLEEVSGARFMQKRGKSGAIVLGIGKLLERLGFENAKEIEFRDLEVQKYVSPLEKNEIWYVQLSKEYERQD